MDQPSGLPLTNDRPKFTNLASAAAWSPSRLLSVLLFSNLGLIAVAVAHGIHDAGDAGRHTDGLYVVLVAAAEMFATAFCSFRVFAIRSRHGSAGKFAKARCLAWVLIGLGFVYLPLDEYFSLHQGIDTLIHHTLAMQETAWSDRIDDAVIATYGLVGIAVLWFAWPELKRFVDRRRLVTGFILMGVAVVFDAVSDRPDIATWLVGDVLSGHRLNGAFQVVEALVQIAAQSFFLVTFFEAYLRAKSDPATQNAAAPGVRG